MRGDFIRISRGNGFSFFSKSSGKWWEKQETNRTRQTKEALVDGWRCGTEAKTLHYQAELRLKQRNKNSVIQSSNACHSCLSKPNTVFFGNTSVIVPSHPEVSERPRKGHAPVRHYRQTTPWVVQSPQTRQMRRPAIYSCCMAKRTWRWL